MFSGSLLVQPVIYPVNKICKEDSNLFISNDNVHFGGRKRRSQWEVKGVKVKWFKWKRSRHQKLNLLQNGGVGPPQTKGKFSLEGSFSAWTSNVSPLRGQSFKLSRTALEVTLSVRVRVVRVVRVIQLVRVAWVV